MKVLVAGVGNIFNGDDGFGVAVAQRLATVEMPAGVVVRDTGIRGVHLAYELLDGYDALVIVDALPGDDAPGTLTVLEVDQLDAAGAVMDAHSMDPRAVLTMLEDLGGSVEQVLVVGCQPADVDERIGLSAPVEAAVDDGVRLVQELVDELTARADRSSGRRLSPPLFRSWPASPAGPLGPRPCLSARPLTAGADDPSARRLAPPSSALAGFAGGPLGPRARLSARPQVGVPCGASEER